MRSSKWGGNGKLFWINCALPYNLATTPKRSTWPGNCVDSKMKRVLELIRVSTEAQAGGDRASIPAQRAVNRRTCAQFGLEIARSIEISDVSGASVLLAPEIQQLLVLMQSPDIDGVVTREFSRLMRPENFADYALLQEFVDSKTVLYLPEGPIDLTSKTGRLMGTIRAANSTILERLAHDLQDIAWKFGQLIQKQNAVVGPRNFAGAWHRAASNQSGVGNGVVRRAEGANTNQPGAGIKHAGLRGFQGFLKAKRRQDGGHPLG
jgi:hypothetical protein